MDDRKLLLSPPPLGNEGEKPLGNPKQRSCVSVSRIRISLLFQVSRLNVVLLSRQT